MKLNRKGYLTVEVILASVVAIAIAFFLMEITIKLVNVTDDYYVDTELLTDKALIIENIKGLIEKDIKEYGGIQKIELKGNNSLYIYSCSGKQEDGRYIYIDGDTIVYEDDAQPQSILYQKKLNKNLDSNSINLEQIGSTNTSGYIMFKLTSDNKFSKEPFEADIIVYNNKTCS